MTEKKLKTPSQIKESNSKINFGLMSSSNPAPDGFTVTHRGDTLWEDRTVGGNDRAAIEKIIETGSAAQKRTLSRNFMKIDGLYRRVVEFYSTLFQYEGVLIPNVKGSGKIEDTANANKYFAALDYVDKSNIKDIAYRIMKGVVRDGVFFGLIVESKEKMVVAELPSQDCRTRYTDADGIGVVELNIKPIADLKETGDYEYIDLLEFFPPHIQQYIYAYAKNHDLDPWVVLPSNVAFALSTADQAPMFITSIPSMMDYSDAISRQSRREIEELKKIIVQKIPHMSDGTLLFEPVEAVEIHRGSVDMLGDDNPNTAVLTTYADVEAIVSKVNADPASTNTVQRMKDHVYNVSGTSGQVISATGNGAMENSLNNDLALMAPLINLLSAKITQIINLKFSIKNLSFKYTILPLTWYNADKVLKNAKELATLGYSFIIPAAVLGLNQKDLISLKNLENNLLHLDTILIPLQSSFTQSGDQDGGRPSVSDTEKSPATIESDTSREGGKPRNEK